ncbi:MAG TPA: ABC transporter permease [Alphaproteobacteria bacterium]|nr:ABC transporter permease [Alphaproteobacteria bacterium]
MSGTLGKSLQIAMLIALYVFLYAPIAYIAYVSFQEDSVWPFPPGFALEHYLSLFELRDFHSALWNSLAIALGTAALSSFFATMASIAVLRYPLRLRAVAAALYLAPLFIAHVLIGISSLMFYRTVLGIPGNLFSAVLANTAYATAFAFLVLLAQLLRYDWRLDEAAMVFGAPPRRTFIEVTFPLIWPAVLGAAIVSFLLAFNNLEVTFYQVGAVPTLPTLAWGELRHGVSEELYALTSIINAAVFLLLIALYCLLRAGWLRLDYRA